MMDKKVQETPEVSSWRGALDRRVAELGELVATATEVDRRLTFERSFIERILAPGYIEDMQRAYETFATRHEFEPGQLVRWKAGMRNKLRPPDGAPSIVIDVLTEPQYDARDDRDSGSRYYREPLDIILGMIDEDGEFSVYHFDSRRFEPFVDDE